MDRATAWPRTGPDRRHTRARHHPPPRGRRLSPAIVGQPGKPPSRRPPMSTNVVVLVGNPRAGSRTRQMAETLTEALLDRLGLKPDGFEVLELAEIVGVSFGPEPAYGSKA